LKDQLSDALGADAGGASAVGAEAATGREGFAGFLAAVAVVVGAAPGLADVGRGDSSDALAAAAGDDTERCAEDVVPGSGVMMLTAGVDAALGNSALVGRPVGSDTPSEATGAAAGATATGGAFHAAA
jgi:hypothetical protein